MPESLSQINAKLYQGKEYIEAFLHPDFKSSSRLAVTLFLQYRNDSQREKYLSKLYHRDSNGPLGSPVANVNTDIWPTNSKVLDFGCGLGLVTNELLPNVGSVVAVDISPSFMEAYRERITSDRAESHLVDLLDGKDHGLDRDFDAAVSNWAYHHLEDALKATNALKNHVKNGGWIFAMDFDGAGLHEQSCIRYGWDKQLIMENNGVNIDYQNPDNIAKAFDDAGLKDVSITKGIELEMWYEESQEAKIFFSDEERAVAETRRNENGELEYRLVCKLAMIAGRVERQ